ncbi:MAG TPA: hypothetical protein VLS25_05040 [Dehalococcoidia bacterium]|nr:hypothetical protein [Dehalococcoidia bacterium]
MPLLALFASLPGPRPAVAQPAVQGDVNCSSAVDSVDSLQVLRSVAGLSSNADCLDIAGDADCSGGVNSVDALKILRYVAGLTNSAPAGCTPIGDPLGPAPTSFDLIAAALAAHDIDDEEALLYRIYASFGDSRLPPQYKGDDSDVFENSAMGDLPDAWDALSQGTKDLLAPFLLTPAEPGSWFEQQGASVAAAAPAATDWATISPPTVKAKIWYHASHPADAVTAQKFADALESTIWPNLTQLMGRPPMPDCGAACPSGGGDDRFDIYLVSENVRSYVKWNTPDGAPACKKTPAVMVIRRNASLATLAHEFLHGIQYAFNLAGPCPEYRWFEEASAQWAMDYVYPSGPPGGPPNEEQLAAPYMLDEPYMMLNYHDDRHEYGAYLFPFYLARMKGQPQIVGTMWQNFETTADSLEAINDALLEHLLGGFEEVWPKVALYNWNRPPVDDYKTLDQLAKGADTVDGGIVAVTLGGASSRDFDVTTDVSYLSAFYHHFQFADDAVHSVVFDNVVADYPHGSVQALVKIGGAWKEPEDWTHDLQKTFCRDIESEHIEELVIIVSYSNWEDKDVMMPAENAVLHANDSGCSRWAGEATAAYHNAQIGDFTETATARNVVFERIPPEPGPIGWELFKAVSGTVKWEVSGYIGGCSLSGSVTVQVQDGDGILQVSNYVTTPEGDRMYNGSAASEAILPVTMACPDSPPVLLEWAKGLYSWFSTGGMQLVGQDGSRLVGQFDNMLGGSGEQYTWDLSAAK